MVDMKVEFVERLCYDHLSRTSELNLPKRWSTMKIAVQDCQNGCVHTERKRSRKRVVLNARAAYCRLDEDRQLLQLNVCFTVILLANRLLLTIRRFVNTSS